MKLPSDIKPQDAIKALHKAGFQETNRVGSHFHFHHPDCRRTQVAMHTKPLAKGTLKAILKQTGLTIEKFKKHRIG